MRTNVEIDDRLMAAAMKATGQKTKKATIDEALRRVVLIERQKLALKRLKGLGWQGDLDAMRRGEVLEPAE